MVLRNRRGGITPAEGCMFGAVVLFVILLVGILYIAFMRFRNPPTPTPRPAPGAAVASPPDAIALSSLRSAPFRFAGTVLVAPHAKLDG